MNETKTGIKTSEFWFSAVAAIAGLLYASGVIAPESGGDKILGLIATVLSAMGYTVSRSIAKKQ
ncbi:MAG: hypothetical protein GY904_15295 [Planctomycetaceae bacterium]|jgi:hypothetical protein|nr:hypothetical protein [Planctomycetaceae bacterium]